MTNSERIKAAFGSVKAPDGIADRVLSGVSSNTSVRLQQKRNIIFIAAAVLALTTTTLAAAGYLGGFERLREIIGEERSEGLYPVEKGNLIGERLTDEGIKIEIVAVGVDSTVLDFYITLEDMVSNRLDGDIRVDALVDPIIEEGGWGMHAFLPEVINRSDDGIVTLWGREYFLEPVTGQKFQFNLYNIAYNIVSGDQEMDVDFTSLETYVPTDWIWDTPILPSDLHNLELYVEGMEYSWKTSISSIGIIDGKLHIQQKMNPGFWNPGYECMFGSIQFKLFDPSGKLVQYHVDPQQESVPFFSVNWRGDVAIGRDQYNSTSYYEYIYDADMERISEYRLVADYYKADSIDLGLWSTVFEIAAPE